MEGSSIKKSEEEGVVDSDILLYEGLKVDLSCRLADHPSHYIFEGFRPLQPHSDLSQIEDEDKLRRLENSRKSESDYYHLNNHHIFRNESFGSKIRS